MSKTRIALSLLVVLAIAGAVAAFPLGDEPEDSSRPVPTVAPASQNGDATHDADRHLQVEEQLRTAIDNIPSDLKIWIDEDTVVYVLPRDPHAFSGDKIAVAHHLPTAAVKNYAASGEDSFAEDTAHHPDAKAAADRMHQDPRVANAVSDLLGSE